MQHFSTTHLRHIVLIHILITMKSGGTEKTVRLLLITECMTEVKQLTRINQIIAYMDVLGFRRFVSKSA